MAKDAPMSKLEIIDFGHDTAEFDKHLKDYFLQTPSYQSIKDGSKSIIIGRKGSGKTALSRYFIETENKASEYAIPIEATHSTYIKIDECLKSFQSTIHNLDSSFKLGWLFTTLLSIILRMLEERSSLISKEEAALYKLAIEEYGFDESDPISAIASYAFDWIKNLKKVGVLERDITQQQKKTILDEVQIKKKILEITTRINKQGKKIYLFYDKLDERWDGSDVYRSFLQGLLLAIKDLKMMHKHIYPVVLLRTDIFNIVTTDFQHIDHFRMEILPIKWDEMSLVELITLRIKHSLLHKGIRPIPENPEDIWHLAFPKSIPAKRAPIPSTAYIVERTLGRPRDIIFFSNIIKYSCIESKRCSIEVDDIHTAESSYSDTKLKDLIAELSYLYPGLTNVLNYFKQKHYGFNNYDFRCLLLDIIDNLSSELPWLPTDDTTLLRLLYEIGFISYTEKGGKLRGTRVIHSAIEPDTDVILSKERIYVSPIFRKALKMKEN